MSGVSAIQFTKMSVSVDIIDRGRSRFRDTENF